MVRRMPTDKMIIKEGCISTLLKEEKSRKVREKGTGNLIMYW